MTGAIMAMARRLRQCLHNSPPSPSICASASPDELHNHIPSPLPQSPPLSHPKIFASRRSEPKICTTSHHTTNTALSMRGAHRGEVHPSKQSRTMDSGILWPSRDHHSSDEKRPQEW